MNLVDQVSIAKLQAKAEEELKAGDVDRATRLLGNAMQGTQRYGQRQGDAGAGGPARSDQEDPDAADQGGQTTLLQAQAVVRKTQMLDPEALKDFQKSE